jgi:hypothetical protein
VSWRGLLGAFVVGICVIAPIVEAFDAWDHTLQDGNDTEANLVVAAVCVGVALTIGTPLIVSRLRARRLVARVRVQLVRRVWSATSPLTVPQPATSPPLALRI